MKKEEIHFLDWKRWLFGQTPPEFMIEVAIRTVLIYAILILAVRLMGKRMTGQVTLNELAVMITLGAIVSPVMQLPDRGLVFGIIGLIVANVFQRSSTWLEFRFKQVEHLTQGDITLLVKDGVMILESLKRTNISRQQLYAMLREQKIENLGKVKRAYLEGCGVLSVYQTEENLAGLPIFPPIDPIAREMLTQVDHQAKACCNCGHVQQLIQSHAPCELCGESDWTEAYLAVPEKE